MKEMGVQGHQLGSHISDSEHIAASKRRESEEPIDVY